MAAEWSVITADSIRQQGTQIIVVIAEIHSRKLLCQCLRIKISTDDTKSHKNSSLLLISNRVIYGRVEAQFIDWLQV